MKKLFILIAAASLVAACSEDVTTTRSDGDKHNISFSVTDADVVGVQTQNASTRSNVLSFINSAPWMAEQMSEPEVETQVVAVETDLPTKEPLCLTITDEPFIRRTNTNATRGALINAVDAKDYLKFGVTELNLAENTIYIDNNLPVWESTLDAGTHLELFKASATWEFDAYDGTQYSFYAYAPRITSDNEHGMTLSNSNRTITYNPTGIGAGDQPDLMTAPKHTSAYVGAIPLTFHHRLCAVQVKTAADAWDATGYKISGIQFQNIYYSGTFNIDSDKDAAWLSYNGGTPGAKSNYTATGFVPDVSAANTVVAGDASTWLMMVPQTLSGAKLSITLQSTTDAEKTFSVTAPINNSVWRAGHTITYTVNPEHIGTLKVTYPEGSNRWNTGTGYVDGPVTSYDNGQSFGLFVVDKDYKVIISNQEVTAASASATPDLTITSPIFLSKQYRYFLMYPYSTTATGLADRAVNTQLSASDVASANAFFSAIISNWSPNGDQSDISKWKAQDLQVGMMSGTNFSMKHSMGLANIKMASSVAGTSKETLILSANTTSESYYTNAATGDYYALDEFVTNLPYKVGTRAKADAANLNCYFIVNPAKSYTFSTPYKYADADANRQWNNFTVSSSSNPISNGCYKEITTSVPRFKNLGRLYSCTKASQTYTTIMEAKYKIECWGAQGGSLNKDKSSWTGQGGHGGYVSGTTTFENNKALYVYVGGYPIEYNYSGYETGGWNGGGNTVGAAAGGGATDVRLVSGDWNNVPSLCSRIIVAGSGGGADVHIAGGYGGGLTAGSGDLDVASVSNGYSVAGYVNATGGTQTAGGSGGSTYTYGSNTQVGTPGSFGQGGSNGSVDGGAGSSGYYGGGHSSCPWASGGGGSSFISGHTGCNAITASVNSLNDITPSDQPDHYSGYKFNPTKMIDGSGHVWETTTQGGLELMPDPGSVNGTKLSGKGQTGDGRARITCMPYPY